MSNTAFAVHSHRRWTHTLRSVGTLTAADDKDFLTIPFSEGRLVGAVITVLTTGTSSGGTSVTLEKHRDGTAVDLLAAAETIAYNATTYSAVVLPSDLSTTVGATVVRQGDQIGLNIDAIPGGTASTNLSVMLIFHIDKD